MGEKDFRAAWRQADRIWDVPGLETYHGKDVYLTEVLTSEAIREVEAVKAETPFHLYLSHYTVHAPWEKCDRFYQKYVDAGLKPLEATLASMVEGMDKSLGDVLDALKRLGVEKERSSCSCPTTGRRPSARGTYHCEGTRLPPTRAASGCR